VRQLFVPKVPLTQALWVWLCLEQTVKEGGVEVCSVPTLALACLYGSVEIVRVLLDHGANMLATAVSGTDMPCARKMEAACR
jgi:hypothetical protein